MRPKPVILCTYTDPQYVCHEVLAAEGVYAIAFQGRPVGLKKYSSLLDVGAKYPRSAFSNPVHCLNLAKVLNRRFHCNYFSVLLLTEGKTVDDPR